MGHFLKTGFQSTRKSRDITLPTKVRLVKPMVFPPIFIFGGLANAKELIVDATKVYLEKYMMPVFKDKVKVLPSALLGTNIAVLGASALVM